MVFAALQHHHVVRREKMCRRASVVEIACWRRRLERGGMNAQRACGRQEWGKEPAEHQSRAVRYSGEKCLLERGVVKPARMRSFPCASPGNASAGESRTNYVSPLRPAGSMNLGGVSRLNQQG
jgi:hypothetical protein